MKSFSVLLLLLIGQTLTQAHQPKVSYLSIGLNSFTYRSIATFITLWDVLAIANCAPADPSLITEDKHVEDVDITLTPTDTTMAVTEYRRGSGGGSGGSVWWGGGRGGNGETLQTSVILILSLVLSAIILSS